MTKKKDMGKAYFDKDRIRFGKLSTTLLNFGFGTKWFFIRYAYLFPFKSKEIENRFKYSKDIIEKEKKKILRKKIQLCLFLDQDIQSMI